MECSITQGKGCLSPAQRPRVGGATRLDPCAKGWGSPFAAVRDGAKICCLCLALVVTTGATAQQRTYKICDNSGCENRPADPATRTGQKEFSVVPDADIWRGETIEQLKQEEGRGSTAATYKIGQVYEFGLADQRRNLTQAANQYFKASTAGHGWASFRLAHLVRSGVQPDGQSLRHWKLTFDAAANGVAMAAHNVAAMYETGNGAPKSASEARRWYEVAAEAGINEARFALALLYMKGIDGERRQLYEGGRYLRQSAEGGLTEARFVLGRLYLSGGDVVRQDLDQATYWLKAAASDDHAGAKELMKEVEAKLKARAELQREYAERQAETLRFVLGVAAQAFLSPPPAVASNAAYETCVNDTRAALTGRCERLRE